MKVHYYVSLWVQTYLLGLIECLWGLTHICLPDLWLAWREHFSCLWRLPWCPPTPHLDSHSTRWPAADLKHRGSHVKPQQTWAETQNQSRLLSVQQHKIKHIDWKQNRGFRGNILIQFLTLRKLCWLVKSNINRNPMASRKKAVVRLRNLKKSRFF